MSGNTFKMKHIDMSFSNTWMLTFTLYCLLALQQQVATERGQCGQAKIDAAQ